MIASYMSTLQVTFWFTVGAAVIGYLVVAWVELPNLKKAEQEDSVSGSETSSLLEEYDGDDEAGGLVRADSYSSG